MVRIEVLGRFPTLNIYQRLNHWQHTKQKNTHSEAIGWAVRASKLKQVPTPMTLDVTCYTARKRDVDNCVVAAKYFLDVLKRMELIPDDNPDYVTCLILRWKKAEKGNEKTIFLIQ